MVKTYTEESVANLVKIQDFRIGNQDYQDPDIGGSRHQDFESKTSDDLKFNNFPNCFN